jgi:hypothetical protein
MMGYAQFAEAVLTAQGRRDLPRKDFALPDKSGQGGRFPLNDAKHVHAAMGRIGSAKGLSAEQKMQIRRKIVAKAKTMNVGTPNFSKTIKRRKRG